MRTAMTSAAPLLTMLLLTFQVQANCNGPFDHKTPTPEELHRVLAEHQAGKKANLCEANLTGANLGGTYLAGANLGGAYLAGANLGGAYLIGAYLARANLAEANLDRVDLAGVDLAGANLDRANLSGAYLGRTNLSGAYLGKANLIGANMTGANLGGVYLGGANLDAAILTGAYMDGANLGGANLIVANLSGANLTVANLDGANLDGANLTGANLTGTNLGGAYLDGANLAETSFAPNADKLPNIASIAFAKNLDKMTVSPPSLPALSKLREAFKNDGFRDAERIMTYLVKRQQEKKGTLDGFINHVFINWTCGYGLYPGRCLQILFALVLLLSPVYLYALRRPEGGGLWAIWSPDRVDKAEGQAEPVRLSFAQPMPLSIPAAKHCDPFSGLRQQPQALRPGRVIRFLRSIARLLQACGIAFYFSLLSAFHFGWRDLNVGNWIARVQPREYALRPTGWVRIVSGMQSLASVYLIALWVLSYFGRPFE